MVAVCKACKPSASNKAIATTPVSVDQKIRCQTGEGIFSLEDKMSSTKAPESADVTKKITIMNTAKIEVIVLMGIFSKKTNSAWVTSFCTTTPNSDRPSTKI